jgi:hypothetical protein
LFNLNFHQQFWEYKVDEKLHLGVCERKKKSLSTTDLEMWEPQNLAALSLHDLPYGDGHTL